MRRCEDLVRRAAAETSPDVIILPEGFTSPNVFDPVERSVPMPVDGPAYQLLRRLSKELGCAVGGGYVAVRGRDTRGTYVLAEPDGATHLHDKDEPSGWEYCYYTPGRDDGVFQTSFGLIGCVMGYETARSRTARRLRAAGVRLILGGECWPGLPEWPVLRGLLSREGAYYALSAKEATGVLARAVGVPAATAWSVGPVRARTPMAPGVPWPCELHGETQIVERDGRILQRLGPNDGEGFIADDVTLAEPEPLDDIPSAFWLRPNTFFIHVAWHALKHHGRLRYRYDKRRGLFPWTALPPHDIPNHNTIPEPTTVEEPVP